MTTACPSTYALPLVLFLAGCSGADDASAASGGKCADRARTSLEVTTDNKFGTLHGALEVPAGCGPFDAVLVVPGSGATDREGNSAGAAGTSDTYRLLATALADRGIASLRYDKAGVGASRGAAPAREADMRVEMGADDVVQWMGALRGNTQVRTVTLAGHSEGSLVAMLATRKAKVDGFVSIAGAGRPAAVILREQLAHNIADAAALTAANDILDKLERGETVADVPASLASIFRPSVQPYIISWMAYDPAKVIAELPLPIAVVQGTTDIQVTVEDAKLLADARPGAKLVVIDGMCHTLKEAALTNAAQQEAYTNPRLPVVPEVVDEIEAIARSK
jgi:pimeloyl-ACP methyl ester carboxylesterase